MTRQELDCLIKDPRNRRLGFYHCAADPRVVVPKGRPWMGWTINTARPMAAPVLLLFIAFLAAPLLISERLGAGTAFRCGVETLAIAAVCMVCAYLSSRTE